MASFDTKNIDDLKELSKLTGSEKTIVTYDGKETRKVSISTIIGFASSVLSNSSTPVMTNLSNLGGQSIIFIPKGEEISISERSPGCFYLEETNQTSIRTMINIPTSVQVSSNLGLRRL